jgi:Transport and Golgi organisation 2
MCTLSVIKLPGNGYRVVHSRDEQRARGRAYPPAERVINGKRVWYPTDSDAGGTWVVCDADGVTAGVLNFNCSNRRNPNPIQSRGEIPLMMIEQPSIESMLEMLQGMDLSVYATFTAFAIKPTDHGVEAFIVEWDAHELRIVRTPDQAFEPIIVASSGLGDEHVQVRVPLFEQIVGANPTPESQDEYTWHRWDDRPEFSVLMSRKDARTVSITTVEVGGHESGSVVPEMSYEELAENDPVHDPIGAGMLQ